VVVVVHNWQLTGRLNMQVATFDMVEDFWGIFNNIRPPSRLNAGTNYHLFKVGIEPMWEHDANKAGGKWNYK
jgi:translation initiation factor 4E